MKGTYNAVFYSKTEFMVIFFLKFVVKILVSIFDTHTMSKVLHHIPCNFLRDHGDFLP